MFPDGKWQSMEEQGRRLRTGTGIQILVATPGRLIDALERRYIVFNQCNYVVLDEADRMIDMGFEPQVKQILDSMHGPWKSTDEDEAAKQEAESKAAKGGVGIMYRTVIMFSATMPREVEDLANKYMRSPCVIKIGDSDSGKNKRIIQHVEVMTEGQKKGRLEKLLRQCQPPVIVFINAKKGVDVVAREIGKMGFRACILHGGKKQSEREDAIEAFKKGEYNIMCATDVAGRGLDIDGVQHVINYDMATSIDK